MKKNKLLILILLFNFYLVFPKHIFALDNYSFSAHLVGKNIDVDVLWPEIDRQSAEILTWLADRSTVTTDPIHQAVSGMFTPPDRIVITKSLLIWFSLSGSLGGVTNGGGGFIRGIWTLGQDSRGNYNFSQMKNNNNWAPNELLPGSDGKGAQGSGLSFIGLAGMENTDDPNMPGGFGAENSGARSFVLDKAPITDGGWGNGKGYFYQTRGYLVHGQMNSSILSNAGYDSIYDMNPTPGLEVKVEFLHGYRILVDEPKIEYGISLTPRGGTAGPFAGFGWSNNTHGSNGFEHKYYQVDVGTATYNGCNRTPEFPSNQKVYFGETDGLRWWGNATLKSPGTRWILAETSDGQSGRTLQIEPLLDPPFWIPDKLQLVRNNYSSGNSSVWVNAYDIGYTDVNQCGGNIYWPADQPVYLGARLTFNKPVNFNTIPPSSTPIPPSPTLIPPTPTSPAIATATAGPPSPTPTPIPGDITGPLVFGVADGKVDIYDYNLLIRDFGLSVQAGKPGSPADIDGNGIVNIFDYNTLIGNFGHHN